MKNSSLQGGLALSLVLALAGCGGGNSGGSSNDRHGSVKIDTAGRLAIAEDAGATLRIYDLDSASVVSNFPLANPPSALYASPGGRYALAFQRPQDTVQIADAGVWQEDHGDHLHDYKAAPKMLDFRINGPQPTHYDNRAGQASIFMDGRAPSTVASAVVFNDADLGAGRVGAGIGFAQPMHGFAEPNGSFLVATYRAPDATGATQAEVYSRQGAQYTFVRRLDLPCPAMHGSFTRGNTTVAGCADGVLAISPQATGTGAPAATKIATATGVSTVAGHAQWARFIGMGNAGTPSTTRFYDIDTAAGTATAISIAGWTEGRLRRAHGFDRAGRYFFVLDDAGTLHALERGASGWTSRKSIAGAIPAAPAAAPFPSLVANEARDEVYLSDPGARQLVAINTATLEVARRTNLDFRPTALAWLGIAR
ncbi:hypothetical protein [Acidovorax sp. FJL06]|uniref:hypothetical protein n=1 Tax=Acidovorax sp. FJL06 TaxID=2153365 RepID=UPI000F56A1C6|nr:hypothetical protein [Acidovorax sp. FJL06]RQO79927.1 hypothetical protein DBV10_21080 [Acidovorax sp. FJL06]